MDSSLWVANVITTEDPILIKRVRDPFGWMSNMSPHNVFYEGFSYRSTEALFQCLRVVEGPLRDLIRSQKHPMEAKRVATENASKRVIKPLGTKDLENMLLCLRLKVEQHPHLKERLLETSTRVIVEDCTNRPQGTGFFWGAAKKTDIQWVGLNQLGVSWMQLRKELSSPEDNLDIFNFINERGSK